MDEREAAFQQHMASGLAAEQRGDLPGACARYADAAHLYPERAIPLLYLGHALILMGREADAAQVVSLGEELNPGLTRIWRSAKADPRIAERSRQADRVLRQVLTRLHEGSVAGYESDHGLPPLHRVRGAIWCQTHDRPFDYLDPDQKPWLLYLPHLPPQRWFEPRELPWAADLVAAYPAIREEALGALGELSRQRAPYLPARAAPPLGLEALHGSDRWSSVHLYQEGRRASREVLERFPRTLAALQAVDCVRLHGNPMEVFLSILDAHTRIPPHYGLANTRLTVHLPLQVPEDCGVRVAEESRAAEPGVLLAFDDSILHEAWNGSDGVRIHLIFEAWRPDLTEEEKGAITRTMEDRDRWNYRRRIPILNPESEP